MASVQLRDIDKFDNGLTELIILPHSVYRVGIDRSHYPDIDLYVGKFKYKYTASV